MYTCNRMYTLYKRPIQLETLHIVQYLHACCIPLLPDTIFERGHPLCITELPAIYCENQWYMGLNQVLFFYETKSGIKNLLEKAEEWKKKNPRYTIKK
jgi:hypothetical protein